VRFFALAVAFSLTLAANGAFARTLGCGGSYSSTQASFWNLRNYDDLGSITILRVRFYDAQGALLFDSSVSGIPASDNGVLGAADNTLAPHQTAQFSSDALQSASVLPSLTSNQQPIELLVDWAAPPKAQPLQGGLTRASRSSTGTELGRAGYGCVDVTPTP